MSKVKIELVVRATRDGKLLHEIAIPLDAPVNTTYPSDLSPQAVVAMSDLDVTADLFKNHIEAAESAPIRAMVLGVVSCLLNDARKSLEAK